MAEPLDTLSDSSSKLDFNLTLPVEIKAKIFKHVCSVNLLDWDNDLFYGFTRPTKLSLVCKLWNDIISTTPELWSTMIIQYKTKQGCESNKKLFDLHLSRSGDMPLNICLVFWRYAKWEVMRVEASEAMDVVMKLSNRIAFLGIRGGAKRDPELAEKFQQISLTDFPILEEARFIELDVFYPENASNAVFKNSHLRTLSLSYMKYSSTAFQYFKQITDLRLHLAPAYHCIVAFWYLPQLKSVTIENAEVNLYKPPVPVFTFPDSTESLVHSSLTSLTIAETYEGEMTLILRSIICPSLVHLDLRTISKHFKKEQVGDFGFMESIMKFLKQSGCSLQTLRMSRHFLGNEFWPILDCVHTTIEKLHLEEGYATDIHDVPTVLFQRLLSGTYLPNLQQLDFNQTLSKNLDYNLILEALQARRKISPSFRTFKSEIEYVSTVPDNTVLEGFNQLIREGMSISFKALHNSADVKRFKANFLSKLLVG